MSETICIDEALHEIFAETDLLAFQSKLVFNKQLTRLEHFSDVSDLELRSYGLSEPAIRRLRAAIERKRKKRTKIFGNGNKHLRLVQVTRASEPVERQGFEFNNTQPFLIPQNEIKLMETLGEGNFSVVKRAMWTRSDGSKTECAVKILHDMSESMRQDLAVEITNMQKLRHQNLVLLFGVVFAATADANKTLMVIEFCEGGSLLNRLRDQTKPWPLVTTLLNYAQQIANGMSYLESRRCVHRDLAARNVLLTQEDQIIKICDFGLARALNENERLYIMHEPKKVPFSWCPPESLRYRQFSHKSDVWAFGVTLWELFTYGEEPWIGCRAAEVLQLIESGQRLKKPEYCSQELYDIMKICWNNEPEERPRFSHLRNLLIDIKFMQIICRTQNLPVNIMDDGKQLGLSADDEIILIEERNSDIWYGQSMASRKFGEFSRCYVTMKNVPAVEQQHSMQSPIKNGMITSTNIQISFPVAGSFIHTGHGDIDERRCWGHVDHIEDIYLRNPIISADTMNATNNSNPTNQKVTFIPSVLTAQKQQASNCTTNNIDAESKTAVFILPPPQSNSTPKPFLPMPSSYSASMPCRYKQQTTSSNVINNGHKTQSEHEQDAFEWISSELSQLNTARKNNTTRKGSVPLVEPLPLSFTTGQSQSRTANSNGNSKYDSSISIPRPNRISPVNNRITPPFISTQNFMTKPAETTTEFGAANFLFPATTSGQKFSSVSLPSSTFSLNTIGQQREQQTINQHTKHQQQERPSSTHSMFMSNNTYLAPNGQQSTTNKNEGEDPFLVKDDIKTLAAKLSYKEVHKAKDFLLSNSTTTVSVPSTSYLTNDRPLQAGQPEQFCRTSNVAIVHPIVNNTEINQQKQQPASSNSPSPYESLLPPPSELLLSGFTDKTPMATPLPKNCLEMTKNGNALNYQPIFNVLGQLSANDGTNHPRIRYGSNGIPILEPVPICTYTQKCTKNMGNEQQNDVNKTQSTMVTLNDLDTNMLLNRVKSNVDFASAEQCRQFLWRNAFDVEKTIKELKIEKLLEMGLATDRELAASALDSAQWDVNAAADRLCC